MALLPSHFSSRFVGDALFDTTSRTTLLVASVVGVVAAWASSVPSSLRFWLLFLSLLCWIASVAHTTVCGFIAAINPPGSFESRIWTTVGVGGIGMAILCAVQLECIRVLFARPDLSWNTDWRYAWNHAQGIADSDHWTGRLTTPAAQSSTMSVRLGSPVRHKRFSDSVWRTCSSASFRLFAH